VWVYVPQTVSDMSARSRHASGRSRGTDTCLDGVVIGPSLPICATAPRCTNTWMMGGSAARRTLTFATLIGSRGISGGRKFFVGGNWKCNGSVSQVEVSRRGRLGGQEGPASEHASRESACVPV
jgi:hypothetical protein